MKTFIAVIAFFLALSLVDAAEAGPLRAALRGGGKAVVGVAKVLRPAGRAAKAVLPPYRR